MRFSMKKLKKNSLSLEQEQHVIIIYCFKQVIEKKMAVNREVHIIFMDLQNTYDRISIIKLWETLKQSNINHFLIEALQDQDTMKQNRK
jgi:hypothetical protein